MTRPVGFEIGDAAPAPLPRRTEAEVIARWKGDQPLVSIICATYQHVGFIEDALRGFLGQDTDFPFEILVRDDASTDGTAEIVRDYADRYPNIIRAVLESENRYPEVRPGQVLRAMRRGEFVASCEGDDYWTDPRGLRAMVEALLNDPRAIAAHHSFVHVRDGRIERVPVESSRSQWQLMVGEAISLRSTLFRNHDFFGSEEFLAYARRVWAGDRLRAVAAGTLGHLVFVPDIKPAIYRRHAGGISTFAHQDPELRRLQKASDRYWASMFLQSRGELDASGVQLTLACERLLGALDERPGLRARVGVALLLSGIRVLRVALARKMRRIARGFIESLRSGRETSRGASSRRR